MLFHFDFKMYANPYQSDDYMPSLVCQYKIHFRLTWLSVLRLYVFVCFHPWPYLLSIQTFSRESVDVFNIATLVFPDLFLKICSLYGQILITCLKCSRVSFSLSCYSEKMSWGGGWRTHMRRTT